MADVLTKTNLFLPSSSYNSVHRSQKEQQQVSLVSFVSKSCKFKGFPLRGKPVQASWRSRATSFGGGFLGKEVVVREDQRRFRSGLPCLAAIKTQSGFRIGNAHKWWEKGLQPNMREVTSAEDVVDSLANAGDKLVVVDFFSPGCGGCKALHPKLCQLAEMNPDVQFLQVNYEEHKSMCYSLNVHVLPFFRFYRGAHGRLCSFSCTNATIKKFKDALAKHTPDRCSLGPTKGLEEKELIALAANKDLSFTYTPQPVQPEPALAEQQTVSSPARSHSDSSMPIPLPGTPSKAVEGAEEKLLVTSGR